MHKANCFRVLFFFLFRSSKTMSNIFNKTKFISVHLRLIKDQSISRGYMANLHIQINVWMSSQKSKLKSQVRTFRPKFMSKSKSNFKFQISPPANAAVLFVKDSLILSLGLSCLPNRFSGLLSRVGENQVLRAKVGVLSHKWAQKYSCIFVRHPGKFSLSSYS